MAVTARFAVFSARQALCQARCVLAVQPRRHRYKRFVRGKSPEDAKTFQQRLDELQAKDPELDRQVNIGFPLAQQKDTEDAEHKKQNHWMKTRTGLEYAARHRQLKLELKDVKDKWLKEHGPQHIRTIADHYGVYNDLFGVAFFYNTTPLYICYDYDEEFVTPVYYGNKIAPSEAALPPFVEYESPSDALWTLVMSSPDGDLQHNDKECLHWLIANIPGSDIHKGEHLCSYLQPFPPRGVGYMRYVFVLYKQSKRLDLGAYQRSPECKSLSERTFSTLEFYRKHQQDLTPSSLCFFQSQWDTSVRSFFHDILQMKEPSYEFIQPPNYHPAQKRYPHRQPFNLYLDRYRDVKDIQEEVLKERLKTVDPFKPPAPQLPFPVLPLGDHTHPSWLRLRVKNMRLGRHQWKDLKPHV